MARERTTEGPLAVFGANAVREALRSAQPLDRLYLLAGVRHEELLAAARQRGLPVELTDRRQLARLAGSEHHQGVVALGPPFRYAAFERLLGEPCRSVLLLDGIQDPRNLGAILRTARATGVGGVVLPRDRSVGVTPVAISAAAGLLFDLPIARVPNLVRAMTALKDVRFWLTGLVARGGQPLPGFVSPPPVALVLGSEGEGLRALVARTCDFRVSIPMAPGVESLNVAVACGIALYELLLRPRDPFP